MNDETEINADDLDRDDLVDETSYLNKSEANKRRLQDAIDEMNNGIYIKHELIGRQ